MTVASLAASVAGVGIGSHSGLGGALIGLVAGIVCAGVLVFVTNWALIIVTRASGRNPREMENELTTMATWGVAVVAGLVAVAAMAGLL